MSSVHYAKKRNLHYSHVINWFRTKISIEPVKGAILCIRGSRDWRNKVHTDLINIELIEYLSIDLFVCMKTVQLNVILFYEFVFVLTQFDRLACHSCQKWLFENTLFPAHMKAAYFSSNLLGCQLKITLILTVAPPLQFCRSFLMMSRLT